MRPDNINGNMGNPQTWNLYSYVHGNPVNFNDPTGHIAGQGWKDMMSNADPWNEDNNAQVVQSSTDDGQNAQWTGAAPAQSKPVGESHPVSDAEMAADITTVVQWMFSTFGINVPAPSLNKFTWIRDFDSQCKKAGGPILLGENGVRSSTPLSDQLHQTTARERFRGTLVHEWLFHWVSGTPSSFGDGPNKNSIVNSMAAQMIASQIWKGEVTPVAMGASVTINGVTATWKEAAVRRREFNDFYRP
jgi:hypothetical protein